MIEEENVNTDEEILNYMLDTFYNGNEYQKFNAEAFREELKSKNPHDVDRLFYKLFELGLIVRTNVFSGGVDLWMLSYNGMELMRKYGSYANYIKIKKEKEEKQLRNERIDRNIRNGNIIAALVISAVAVILTQFPKDNKEQLNKIEQNIQSIQTEIQDLSKTLNTDTIHKMNQSTKDTATNK